MLYYLGTAVGGGVTGSASRILIGAAALIFTAVVVMMVQQSGVTSAGRKDGDGQEGPPTPQTGDAGVPLPGFQLSAFADQPTDPASTTRRDP